MTFWQSIISEPDNKAYPNLEKEVAKTKLKDIFDYDISFMQLEMMSRKPIESLCRGEFIALLLIAAQLKEDFEQGLVELITNICNRI